MSREGRKAPLTNAERQQRFRVKRKLELEALRRAIQDPNRPGRFAASESLKNTISSIDKELARKKLETKELKQQIEKLQRQLTEFKQVLDAAMVKLSPAARQILSETLRSIEQAASIHIEGDRKMT
jgi:predicted  nucleic acid-binding Zn-ribbon protein